MPSCLNRSSASLAYCSPSRFSTDSKPFWFPLSLIISQPRLRYLGRDSAHRAEPRLLFNDQNHGLFSDNGVIYKNGILYPSFFTEGMPKDSFFRSIKRHSIKIVYSQDKCFLKRNHFIPSPRNFFTWSNVVLAVFFTRPGLCALKHM